MKEKIRALYLKFKNNRHKFKKLLLVVIALLFLENVLLAYDNLQAARPILGLRLGGENISFKDKKGLSEYFQNRQSFLKPLYFFYNGQTFQFVPEEIGLTINFQKETNRILAIGRTGNFLKRLADQNLAVLGIKNTQVTGDISESKLALKIFEVKSKVDQAAVSQMPDFQGDISNTIAAKDGIKVDANKLVSLVNEHAFDSRGGTFDLPVSKEFPISHTADEVDQIRKQAKNLIGNSIVITSGGFYFTLTPQDLKIMLTVVERPDPKNPQKIILNLRVDDVLLNRRLGDFAQKVENITHAEFDDHDARVAIYAQFYSGKRLVLNIPTGRSFPLPVLGAKDQTGQKFVYLTFDDGPNSIYHPLILDILKKYDVKATFFLVGQNSQRDPDIAKRTKAEGHIIGNHSLTHSFLPNLSNASILNEIKSTDEILKLYNDNQDIKLFRPPYGGVNLYVNNDAKNLGLKIFLWDVDPRDWSEPPTEELVRRVVTAAQNGSDILLHSNHMATVQALPKIVETLKAEGYTFKTLD